ncbi:hypothetical protein DFH09DRAFT_1506552 [Mycena vulgaris]|nr:hypothetical protein DFH09DRAFT_1506552 [Mycena vulgaris]
MARRADVVDIVGNSGMIRAGVAATQDQIDASRLAWAGRGRRVGGLRMSGGLDAGGRGLLFILDALTHVGTGCAVRTDGGREVVRLYSEELGRRSPSGAAVTTFFHTLATSPALPPTLKNLAISWNFGGEDYYEEMPPVDEPDFARLCNALLARCPTLTSLWFDGHESLFRWRKGLDGTVNETTAEDFASFDHRYYLKIPFNTGITVCQRWVSVSSHISVQARTKAGKIYIPANSSLASNRKKGTAQMPGPFPALVRALSDFSASEMYIAQSFAAAAPSSSGSRAYLALEWPPTCIWGPKRRLSDGYQAVYSSTANVTRYRYRSARRSERRHYICRDTQWSIRFARASLRPYTFTSLQVVSVQSIARRHDEINGHRARPMRTSAPSPLGLPYSHRSNTPARPTYAHCTRSASTLAHTSRAGRRADIEGGEKHMRGQHGAGHRPMHITKKRREVTGLHRRIAPVIHRLGEGRERRGARRHQVQDELAKQAALARAGGEVHTSWRARLLVMSREIVHAPAIEGSVACRDASTALVLAPGGTRPGIGNGIGPGRAVNTVLDCAASAPRMRIRRQGWPRRSGWLVRATGWNAALAILSPVPCCPSIRRGGTTESVRAQNKVPGARRIAALSGPSLDGGGWHLRRARAP